MHSIRSFQPTDRGAIRDLCCRAAAPDRPLESFFPDRSLFADLMTHYYLDREPDLTLVAEVGDRLSGYLLGSRDSRRQRRWQALRYGPAAVLRFVLRGGLARQQSWRLARANLELVLQRGGRREPGLLTEYPAHLHLAVEAGDRGSGVGSDLVSQLLSRLRAAEVPGVHAVVREENLRARRFFEQRGFVPLARRKALRRPPDPSPAWKITYGRAT